MSDEEEIAKVFKKYFIIYKQEAYQLTDFLNETEVVNKYDYDSMIKNLETSTRHQEYLRKIRKKWMEESKKYKENIEHMKEFQEETYRKKNRDLINKLKKKEKLLLTSLENNQKTRMLERQKAIESMIEKEKLAKKNVENFLQKQEKERLQLQHNTDGKSKKIKIHIIYF